MQTHAAHFEFRIKVLVDELVELQANKWVPRLKKETAKTLDEIHKDFHEQNSFMNNNQRMKPRMNGHAPNNNHKQQRSNHHYVKVNKTQNKIVSDDELKAKMQSLIKKCIISENVSPLMKFLQANNNSVRCNKYWGNQTNQVFVNRKASEIQTYISFLCKLFEAKCIHNKRDEFVRENISFLAENCDDSSSDCPQFATYIGQMMARLFEQRSIPIDSTLSTFHKIYFAQKDKYAETPFRKKKRFSMIVLSILHCLDKSKAQNVLKNVSNQSLVNAKNIDQSVFKNDSSHLFQKFILN